jgi:Transposase DDE domain/DDE_Tnp_1-associated
VPHRLPVVVSAAVRAVVAGYRSYTAIAEWVDDIPATTALTLGTDPDRRPSETMIRRLLPARDPDLLTAAIGDWLTTRATTARPAVKRAIAVDGKTLRGSRTTDTTARQVLAACDQDTGIVHASTDVDGHTNEITRFGPLLDQIGDLRDTTVTVDAWPCQRDHVGYLAERGADWILTVKANQPSLHRQLAALPWRAVPDAARDTDRGHGRREIRTCKILTISTGIGFPLAAQAWQIRRRRPTQRRHRRAPHRRRHPTWRRTPTWRRSHRSSSPARSRAAGTPTRSRSATTYKIAFPISRRPVDPSDAARRGNTPSGIRRPRTRSPASGAAIVDSA